MYQYDSGKFMYVSNEFRFDRISNLFLSPKEIIDMIGEEKFREFKKGFIETDYNDPWCDTVEPYSYKRYCIINNQEHFKLFDIIRFTCQAGKYIYEYQKKIKEYYEEIYKLLYDDEKKLQKVFSPKEITKINHQIKILDKYKKELYLLKSTFDVVPKEMSDSLGQIEIQIRQCDTIIDEIKRFLDDKDNSITDQIDETGSDQIEGGITINADEPGTDVLEGGVTIDADEPGTDVLEGGVTIDADEPGTDVLIGGITIDADEPGTDVVVESNTTKSIAHIIEVREESDTTGSVEHIIVVEESDTSKAIEYVSDVEEESDTAKAVEHVIVVEESDTANIENLYRPDDNSQRNEGYEDIKQERIKFYQPSEKPIDKTEDYSNYEYELSILKLSFIVLTILVFTKYYIL